MDHQQALDFAQEYLQNIVAFFGQNLDVEASLEDEIISLHIESSDLNSILIGRNAETLRSLQFIVSTALRNQGSSLTRVNVDVADYKKQREEKLAEKARGWIEAVRETGDSHVARINAADRRIVHRVASEYDDIQTFSEGEGRDRHIIIAQKTS
jgi:spoIIIJ-associated protein